MARRPAVLLLAVSVSVLLIAGGAVSAAGVFQVRCAPWAVKAQVGGKRVCLRAGQPCVKRFEAQYRRYGFDCTRGVLTARSRWIVADLGSVGLGNVSAINEQGQVIGERADQLIPGTDQPLLHAFVWRDGRFTDLAPVDSFSVALGINDAGQIIGWWGLFPSNGRHDFLWQKGVRTDLGGLRVVAINGRGQIIGDEATADGGHAFLRENGVMSDLGSGGATANNDRGQVVVRTNISPGDTVIWDNGVTTDLGALQGFVAKAINAKGQILGQVVTATGMIRAFLWDNGVLRDLGSLDGRESEPRAINDSGQVIGQSLFASTPGHWRGFLWQDGVMLNLGTLGFDSYATALNDLGHVVGWSETTTGNHAFIWENGHMSDLGTLSECLSTAAVDINDHDQIVGTCYTSTGRTHALMWHALMWTRRRS